MRCARVLVVAAAVLGVGLCAAPARAADPGRWRATGISTIPLEYYQGMASDPARRLFFDGVFLGLYRADANLQSQRRNDAVIPPDVTVREGYNHIGDISWDGREGGRILLPLECYYPGRPGGANSCGTGSIGVADPDTLRWRYYVKLDPAEIPKTMWVEASPDGRLLWTSAGADLLAYRARDVVGANAAPGARPIRAVRRLAGAVPPSGITGAAFYGDRMLIAGQTDSLFQVWSVDLGTGARRLEIERTVFGESEGLDVVRALGGTLHWIITPFDPAGRPPTYPLPGNRLLHFVARGPRARLHLAAEPRQVVVGRRSRITFLATAHGEPAAGVVVRFRGRIARTSAAGSARFTLTLRRPGRYRALAGRPDLRAATAAVRAIEVPATCALYRC